MTGRGTWIRPLLATMGLAVALVLLGVSLPNWWMTPEELRGAYPKYFRGHDRQGLYRVLWERVRESPFVVRASPFRAGIWFLAIPLSGAAGAAALVRGRTRGRQALGLAFLAAALTSVAIGIAGPDAVRPGAAQALFPGAFVTVGGSAAAVWLLYRFALPPGAWRGGVDAVLRVALVVAVAWNMSVLFTRSDLALLLLLHSDRSWIARVSPILGDSWYEVLRYSSPALLVALALVPPLLLAGNSFRDVWRIFRRAHRRFLGMTLGIGVLTLLPVPEALDIALAPRWARLPFATELKYVMLQTLTAGAWLGAVVFLTARAAVWVRAAAAPPPRAAY